MAQERNDIDGRDVTNDGSAADNTALAQSNRIKNEIVETRAQMGETIDAIQDKLSFSNLSEQVSDHVSNAVDTAKEAVYDATIGNAASMMKNIGNEISSTSVVRTVKSNPLPFALIGLGAGLLAYNAYAGKSQKGRKRRTADEGDQVGAPSRGAAASAPGKLSAAAGKVGGAAETAIDSVGNAVGTAYSGAGNVLEKAKDKAGEIGSVVKEQYDTYIEDNPLAVGAVALALGAAVGMAIPTTRYEGELMGGVRQDLVNKVQSTASELIDTTKEAIADSAQGFVEKAKSVAK
jgi:hypothetical protein